MSRRYQTPDGAFLVESVGRVDRSTGLVSDTVLRSTNMDSGDLAVAGVLIGEGISPDSGVAAAAWRVRTSRSGADVVLTPPSAALGSRGLVVDGGARVVASGGLFVPSQSGAPVSVEVSAAAACRTVQVRPGVQTQMARDSVLPDCLRASAAPARAIVAADVAFPPGRSDVLQLSACLSSDGGVTWVDVPGTASTLARPPASSSAAVVAVATPSWVDVPAGRALGLRLRAPSAPAETHLATLSRVSTRVVAA